MKYQQIIKDWGPAVVAVVICVSVIYVFANESAKAPTSLGEQHSATLKLGEQGTVGALALLPITLMEDSRCPQDVQCIQAGTVKVQVQIISGMGPSIMVMELGKAITTEAEEVTLKEVAPAPKANVALDKGAYRFVFEVKERSLEEINP